SVIFSTWVDSASPGSHDAAWLSSTLVNLPASGASAASAPTHSTTITHLPMRLPGTLARLPNPLTTNFTSAFPFRNSAARYRAGPTATQPNLDRPRDKPGSPRRGSPARLSEANSVHSITRGHQPGGLRPP